MSLILFSLGLGIAVGYLRPLSPGQARVAGAVTTVGLFILLVSMGAQLGSNDEVLAGLGRMGLQAIVLAGFSVLGSVLAVYLASGYIYRGLENRVNRRQRGDSR